jgi:hypothetical protein
MKGYDKRIQDSYGPASAQPSIFTGIRWPILGERGNETARFSRTV